MCWNSNISSQKIKILLEYIKNRARWRQNEQICTFDNIGYFFGWRCLDDI